MDRPRPGNGTISYLTSTDPDNNCTCCGGSNTGIGGICPKGSFCVRGSPRPEPCPSGTYSNTQGADRCEPCRAGYFCPIGSVDFEPNPCPAGHYCPENTTHAVEFQCPPGKFNPDMNGKSESDCLDCPAGEFCESFGQNASSGNCSAGFYCTGGSSTPTPVDQPEGSNCPVGFYCPEGGSCFFALLCIAITSLLTELSWPGDRLGAFSLRVNHLKILVCLFGKIARLYSVQ